MLTTSYCDSVKPSMDMMCKSAGGTANDICGTVAPDFCGSMLEQQVASGGLVQLIGATACESDDDCKAGSGTGAGDGTGGGTGGTTKKTCCSVMEKAVDTMCKDTTTVATTTYVSINCLVLCCDAGPRPPLRPAACGGARALATESCLLPFLRP